MKKPSIVILVFLVVLGGITASTLWSCRDTNTVSVQENRKLSTVPELSKETWFSGEYAKGMEDFLADHAYNREQLLAVSEELEAGLEKKMEVKVVSQMVDLGRTETADGPSGQAVPGKETENPGGDGETEERIILEDRIFSTYVSNANARNRYRDAVNDFMDMFPNTVTKSNMIVPSRIAYEQDYQEFTSDQNEDIQKVYQELDKLIYTVDLWNELRREDVDDIYFRTDHHWTADGSYIGAKAYLNKIGRSCVPKEQYTRAEGEPFLGYLYAQTKKKSLEDHMDKLVYYVHPDGISQETVFQRENGTDTQLTPQTEAVLDPSRQGYYTFVESKFVYAVIDGKAEDNSCLLLVGDSYCNVLAPWLSDNFGKVIIVDPREWTEGREKLMELTDQEGVTDVLIADYITVVGNDWFTSQIEKMTR